MTIAAEEGYLGEAGSRTWYRIVGDRTSSDIPLLMIHGGPGAPWPEHLDFVDTIARRRPVVLYHQLGCGRSDDAADPSRWTVDAFVEELTTLRAHLELDEVHLYAWSWGALIAVSYLLGKPEGVRSAVLASPAINVRGWASEAKRLRDELPPSTVAALDRFENDYEPEPPKPGKPREGYSAEQLRRAVPVMRRLLPLIGSRPAQALGRAASRVSFLRKTSHEVVGFQFTTRHLMRPPLREDILTMFSGNNAAMYEAMWGPAEWMLTGSLREIDFTDRLGELDLPVLVTSGRYDEATPALMQDIVDHVRDCEWVVFEDSAHCAILEEPERHAEVVEAFLERG